jgi:adenylate cyclase
VTTESPSGKKKKLFLPISFKLITMISFIVISALLAVTVMATYFFMSDNKVRAMEDTLNYSTLISKKVYTDLTSIVEKGKVAAINLHGAGSGNQASAQAFMETLISRDPDMIFVGLMDRDKIDSIKYLQNNEFFQRKGITLDIKTIIKSEYETISRSFSKEEVVFNPSFYFHEAVIGISLPYDPAVSSTIIIIFYSMDKLLESISTGSIISSFIVSGTGDLIAHRDRDIVKSKTSYAAMPVVNMMMKNPNPNAQTAYRDENGTKSLGAFSRIGYSDSAVVSYVNEDVAFGMVYKIQKIIIWLTGVVLAASFLITLFFSRSLSRPIKKLTDASRKIQDGDYDINIQSVSRDEIGELTESFRDMAQGLVERERIKSAFGKFVNKELAELVMNNEVKIGGERKDVAVFFSDIRSFTKISEALEPEEVVEFLNQYIKRMVGCVNRTKGSVDKFIGDAIMAIWGAPLSSGDDPFNAVNASLMMREQLLEFNLDRGSVKKPVIKIGCGIHYGPVLAGQIGSDEKMEYTVIGDTVNLASRIESLNKAFGTDILISEETANKVKDRIRLVPMQKITVKGKSEPLTVYAVLGRIANPESPKTLEELRKIIGTESYSEVNDEKELNFDKEIKYEIVN